MKRKQGTWVTHSVIHKSNNSNNNTSSGNGSSNVDDDSNNSNERATKLTKKKKKKNLKKTGEFTRTRERKWKENTYRKKERNVFGSSFSILSFHLFRSLVSMPIYFLCVCMPLVRHREGWIHVSSHNIGTYVADTFSNLFACRVSWSCRLVTHAFNEFFFPNTLSSFFPFSVSSLYFKHSQMSMEKVYWGEQKDANLWWQWQRRRYRRWQRNRRQYRNYANSLPSNRTGKKLGREAKRKCKWQLRRHTKRGETQRRRK